MNKIIPVIIFFSFTVSQVSVAATINTCQVTAQIINPSFVKTLTVGSKNCAIKPGQIFEFHDDQPWYKKDNLVFLANVKKITTKKPKNTFSYLIWSGITATSGQIITFDKEFYSDLTEFYSSSKSVKSPAKTSTTKLTTYKNFKFGLQFDYPSNYNDNSEYFEDKPKYERGQDSSYFIWRAAVVSPRFDLDKGNSFEEMISIDAYNLTLNGYKNREQSMSAFEPKYAKWKNIQKYKSIKINSSTALEFVEGMSDMSDKISYAYNILIDQGDKVILFRGEIGKKAIIKKMAASLRNI